MRGASSVVVVVVPKQRDHEGDVKLYIAELLQVQDVVLEA